VLVLGPLANVTLRVGGRLHLAGTLAAAAALVASGSRGALIGALALGLVLIALARDRELRVLVAAGLALIAVGVFALPTTRSRVVGASPLATETVSGRALLWDETVSLIGHHPLLGVGPSGYVDAIPAYHSAHYERKVGPANPPDGAHDWALQAAGAGGLLLALLAVALAGLTLCRGWRATRTQPTGGEQAAVVGLLGGLVGYAVALLFHLTSPGTTSLAAVFAGALLALPACGRDAASAWAAPCRYAAVAGLAVLVAVLLAAAIAEIPLRSGVDAAARGDLAGAQHDFDLARSLRPWDGAVPATAAHAYAVLASDGIAVAAGPGLRWADHELADFPDSVPALEDGATIDAALRNFPRAALLLARAARLEPANPDVWVDSGENALAQRRFAAAVAAFRRAAALVPQDAAARRGLAAARAAAASAR
jgi:hypothetical protein